MNRITANEARALTKRNDGYGIVLESAYRTIRHCAGEGLSESRENLWRESTDVAEKLISRLELDGYELEVAYVNEFTNKLLNREAQYDTLIIRW